MSNATQTAIDRLFHEDLFQINAAIDQEIKSKRMDPLGHLINGSRTIGSTILGICQANANAGFSIVDTKGLSTIEITNLTPGTLHAKNAAQTEFYGTFNAKGEIQNIQSRVTGVLHAGCGFLHPSEGIGGNIDSSAELNISGAFTVEVKGKTASVVSISIQSLVLNFTSENVNINSLGILNSLQGSLDNYIIDSYRYQGKMALQNMLSTSVHNGFQNILPLLHITI